MTMVRAGGDSYHGKRMVENYVSSFEIDIKKSSQKERI